MTERKLQKNDLVWFVLLDEVICRYAFAVCTDKKRMNEEDTERNVTVYYNQNHYHYCAAHDKYRE